MSICSAATLRAVSPKLLSHAPHESNRTRLVKRFAAVDVNTGLFDVPNARRFQALTPAVRRARAAAFDLFGEATLTVEWERAEVSRDERTAVWVGRIAGHPYGLATLASTAGIVSANLNLGDGPLYQIRYAAGDHYLREMDDTQLPPDGQPVIPPPPRHVADAPLAVGDDGSTIDVMVLYTPSVATAEGGAAAVQNLVQLGIAETNQGYANSGIIQRVQLVYSGQWNYTESGNFSTDLSNVQSSTQVQALRDQYGADVVSLWVNSTTLCGLGNLLSTTSYSFADYAYSVVSSSCATGYYSFGHEMGHNMGAHHDRADANSQGLYPYSYGYQQTTAAPFFRTVMSYSCANVLCSRIDYWSNPDISYAGEPTGVSTSSSVAADNSLTLNNSRTIVANFRQSVTASLAVSPASASLPASGGSGSFAITTAGSWSIAGLPSWITLTTPSSGSGNATVGFTAAANPSGSGARSAALTIGAQTITVNEAPSPAACTLTPLTVGAPVAGSLSASSCSSPLRQNTYASRYAFTGTANQQITLTASSSAFSPFLYLLDPSGSVIASSDPNAPAATAALPASGASLTLPSTGSYTVEVTSFDSVQTGAFSLTVANAASAPAPNTAPVIAGFSPGASSGAAQTFTATLSSPLGYQALDVFNLLIANSLDSRQACYVAYQRSTNVLYVVADSGDPTQVTGKLLGGTGTVGNGQCTIDAAASSAAGSGNTLTITLSVNFAPTFTGNKMLYAAVRDINHGNSGWQIVGVHSLAGAATTYPAPAGVSPASGSGMSQAFTFTFQDATDARNLQTAWAVISAALDSRNACVVAYYRPGNQVYLYPDNGDGTQAANMVLTGSNSVGNSQCTISAQGSAVQTSGNTLTVTLPITFNPAFAGNKGIWTAVQTMSGAQTSSWQALGVWQARAR